MEKLYRIINYETGEVAEVSALPENRSYALRWYYKRALSWARDNVRCGMVGVTKMPNRGVHLFGLDGGMIAWEVHLL
jgi:hypothetical protein